MLTRWTGPHWRGHLLALLAGAIVPLSLAPFDLWPLALLSLAVLCLCLRTHSGRDAVVRSWWFGLGLYSSGASWVFVSISEFGQASLPLALLLTGIFVSGLALIFALPFYAYGRWFSHRDLGLLLAFPAFWVLGEWLRSWLLTGFPWLYLGYGHLDTPLAGWAPVGGVFTVSGICALTAAALASALTAYRQPKTLLALITAGILWLAGWGLLQLSWTKPKGEPIKIGMVQANIPQAHKWDPDFRQPTLARFRQMSELLWGRDWVIWPEAAIPMLYHEAGIYLSEFHQRAAESNSALITGILYDDFQQNKYFNSIVGLGTALGIYHKRRLVPFGEYVPLEGWLRGLIHFFDLPTSIISKGPDNQRPLQVGKLFIAPSICYEVVYPDLVANAASSADVLLTISNDAWFGDSIGPLQHLQMARMRALETGRYMIRATNNGVSGIANTRGQLTLKSQRFVQQTLLGEVRAMTGQTPFMRWGSWPVLILSGLILLGLSVRAPRANA